MDVFYDLVAHSAAPWYAFGGHKLKPRLDMKTLIGFDALVRGKCPDWGITAANLVLSMLNGLIATVAFFQLLRLYLYSQESRWTRQKVFHCLIGASSFGYTVYFALNIVAAYEHWRRCWPHACGFITMAIPQIIFLATFLLLLSFWVDLCHQATDKEDEEEDDDEEDEEPLLSTPDVFLATSSSRKGEGPEKHRRCCHCWRRSRIRGRQKFVIAVVLLIFLITIAFALVIWIGMGRNPIDSAVVAQIYTDLFALVIFFSGGGLAGYGLTLYMRMSRVRTGKASSDLQKVAGLAVVSVVCFSIRALLVLLRDIKVLKFKSSSKWHVLVVFLYSLIGEVIPCMVVLWVMRDVPCRSTSTANPSPQPLNGYQQVLAQEQALLEQWIVPEDLESIVVASRSRKIRPGRSDSETGSASNSG